mgnify:CR=1 FL=1|tara:strand:+ start:14387 stop:14536 length:150 start_codon:yes stop_codon:yes gene_type:complete
MSEIKQHTFYFYPEQVEWLIKQKQETRLSFNAIVRILIDKERKKNDTST